MGSNANFLKKSGVLMEENAPPFEGQDIGGCATIWRGGVTSLLVTIATNLSHRT